MTAAGAAPPCPAASAAPETPGEALALLAERRATGALHGPLGSLHLVDGRVTAAESPRAPGLADLLAGCGRITPDGWVRLLRAHGPRSGVGAALLERRLLTRGELELGHLATLFDAAYFVLADPAGGVWRFEDGARHWLGPVADVDPARIRREVDRRRRLLDGIWPWGLLDTAPVRPVEHVRRPSHRPCGRRRRELLDHADGRRTPADLARLLGRSGFGVTADVRRLAAAGLLDAPCPAAVPRPAAPPPAPPRPVVTPPPAPSRPVVTPCPVGPPTVPGVPDAPPTAVPASGVRRPATSRPGGGLHRRIPGASLRGAGLPGPPVEAATAGTPVGTSVGTPVGTSVGTPVGTSVGTPVGTSVGTSVGTPVGTPAGAGAPTRSERPPATAAAHPLAVPDPDVALLTRVRDLLEARL
ncbi:hypothetical protein [Kitasatospora sp. NPDC018619]|uniref:hypothetical protein n=1 Tax=unclassified Kitasatospora TaxID=2633591 RepID=UPI0037B0F1ED